MDRWWVLMLLAVTLAAAGPQLPKRGIHGKGFAGHSSLEPRHGHSFSFDQLYDFQKKFLDNFLYPKNQVQAKAINSTIFAENIQGRVDITRTFEGRELNTEYLFGLFANIAANSKQFTLLGYPTKYEIVHFAASQNIASASTRFTFLFPALGNLSVPIIIDTWNSFNKHGEITQYDAVFKWWDWAVDYLLQSFATANHLNLLQTVEKATQALGGSICQTALTYCNGTNKQYNDKDDCLNFLTKEIRFGKSYELGRNTLLCRMVHQNMVPFRPDVHCGHIGKTGGGYCADDKSYTDTINQNYFTNSPFVYPPKGSKATS